MSLEEKVGQLFVAPICPLREEDHWDDWQNLLNEYHIGNAIVKQSDPESQIQCLNRLQESSKWPLLILADAEWGLGMRMSGTISYPKNRALQDLTLIEELGQEIARQARLVGIHMNLAPVLDVDATSLRSFSNNPEEVAKRGAAIIRGMQKGHLLTCTKHFPGHGNTSVDSHFGLPTQNKLELLPFEWCSETDAVMTAHILVPSLDPKYPATLSSKIVQLAPKNTLIITDALNMKALTLHYSVEEIALLARKAGADLLLYGDHISDVVDSLIHDQIPRAYKTLVAAYRNGELPLDKLDATVERILQAKEKAGLFLKRTVEENPSLNTEYAYTLKQKLERSN